MAKKTKFASKKKGARATKNTKKNAIAFPKNSVADRVLQYVGAADHPDLRNRYSALFGDIRPVDVALASYTDLLKEGAKGALASLSSLMATEGGELKFQVNRIAVGPSAKPDFSVGDARKVAAEYGRAGYDGIAEVRFCPVPDPGTGADMIAMDAVALFTGNPTPTYLGKRRRRTKAADGVQRSAVRAFSLNDEAAVNAALAAIFHPPLTRLPTGDPFEQEGQSFAKGSKQAERALVTLMCRSQLPVKKMLIGFGAGKSIVDGVHGRIEYLLKEQCKGTPPLVHRDLVPHFWFGELRRLELHHLSVPEIKLR